MLAVAEVTRKSAVLIEGGAPCWCRKVGDGNLRHGYSAAVDAAGSTLLVGRFEGRLDLGGQPLSSPGEVSVFGLKLDAHGRHVWSRRLGAGRGQQTWTAAVSPTGSLYFAGACRGRLDIGVDGPPSRGESLFLAKLAPDGKGVWQRRLFTASVPAIERQTLRLAACADDSVMVMGQGALEVEAGGGRPSQWSDLFLHKLAPDGTPLWARHYAGARQTRDHHVFTDAAGCVLLSGYFRGRIAFGGDVLESIAGWDRYIVQLGPDGAHRWSRRLSASQTSSYRVAAVPSGGVLVAGALRSVPRAESARASARIGAPHGWDLFFAHLDASGEPSLSRRFPSDDPTRLHAVLAPGEGGSAVCAGYLDGALDLGLRRKLRSFERDETMFVAKIDAAGQALWARRMHGARRQLGLDVHTDPKGASVLTGYFEGDLAIDGCPAVHAKGEADLFVAKLAP